MAQDGGEAEIRYFGHCIRQPILGSVVNIYMPFSRSYKSGFQNLVPNK
jgi:hypothetical protein